MILRPLVAALCGALLAGCAGHASMTGSERVAIAEANGRQILVMIADPEIGRLELRGARSGAYRQPRAYPRTPTAVARVLAGLAKEFHLTPVDGWPMRTLGVHCAVFKVEQGASVDAVISQLDADERVESVQRMQQFEVRESGEPTSWDDPYRSLQRSLEDAGVDQAHRWSTGQGVRIAVIDTGVAARHPDLRGRMTEVRSFVSGAAVAPDRHGTAVAGVIASVANIRLGIVGVAPGARLLALQACTQQSADGRGRCTSFSLARALDHAIEAESNVLNLSLGGPPDRLLERLLIKAIERNIVVVAARDDGRTNAPFPAALPGVIAVGTEGMPADAAWLRAPGQDVLTLVPPDGYDFQSGSSIAAAHVSGIVALLLERDRNLRPSEIEALLARTSRAVARDGAYSHRLVSACDALASLSGTIICGAVPAHAAHTTAGIEPLKTR